MTILFSIPASAACEPITIPPKLTSIGFIERNGTVDTVFPASEIGCVFAYFATPLVYLYLSSLLKIGIFALLLTVMIFKAPVAIPGFTLGTEVPGMS